MAGSSEGKVSLFGADKLEEETPPEPKQYYLQQNLALGAGLEPSLGNTRSRGDENNAETSSRPLPIRKRAVPTEALRNEPTAKLNSAAPDLFESADFRMEVKLFRSSTSNPQDPCPNMLLNVKSPVQES